MVLEVPAKSHLEISIEFEKSLLKWLEYPPDANKGFYVNSAVISTILEDKNNFTGEKRAIEFDSFGQGLLWHQKHYFNLRVSSTN